MKLTVEFELGEIWEDYHTSDEQRLNALLRHNLVEVKTTIVKNLNLHIASGSLPVENGINFLWWLQNWGHTDEMTTDDKDFKKLVEKYNSCSENDHRK